MFCNGRPATVEDLARPALRNDGHFTTFQLRGGAVRGLELHLQRLDAATQALFGAALDAARVREALRAPLAATATRDATVRITVVPRETGPRADAAPAVDVLVSLAPPGEPGAAPLRLQSFVFQRDTAAIKHVGTFPLFQYQRLARAAGADDALFVDAAGRVAEGSVWNLGLWDGATLTWPEADALRGTQERLLQAGLSALGVPQRTRPVALAELDAPVAAFACNSRGQQAIGTVDGRPLSLSRELDALLRRALATQPLEPAA
ncbi:aminotransferase class IV [Luteimonas sp. BDR2-5]|nr:aminotransferase class IV [Luteimonas sp. BDR2-5]